MNRIVKNYKLLCKKYNVDIYENIRNAGPKLDSENLTENDNHIPSIMDRMEPEELDILYEYIQYLKGMNDKWEQVVSLLFLSKRRWSWDRDIMRQNDIVGKYKDLCKKYNTDIISVLDSEWEKLNSKESTENDNIEPSVLNEMSDEDLDILYEYNKYLESISKW